jgi:hypothetical protein
VTSDDDVGDWMIILTDSLFANKTNCSQNRHRSADCLRHHHPAFRLTSENCLFGGGGGAVL